MVHRHFWFFLELGPAREKGGVRPAWERGKRGWRAGLGWVWAGSVGDWVVVVEMVSVYFGRVVLQYCIPRLGRTRESAPGWIRERKPPAGRPRE